MSLTPEWSIKSSTTCHDAGKSNKHKEWKSHWPRSVNHIKRTQIAPNDKWWYNVVHTNVARHLTTYSLSNFLTFTSYLHVKRRHGDGFSLTNALIICVLWFLIVTTQAVVDDLVHFISISSLQRCFGTKTACLRMKHECYKILMANWWVFKPQFFEGVYQISAACVLYLCTLCSCWSDANANFPRDL